MGKRWLPLESNPEVLNAYIRALGASTQRYEFCDLFGLDDELLAMVPQPVLALLLLFPCAGGSAKAGGELEKATGANDVYYMKQTIRNACGTIGVLHAVLNHHDALQFSPGSFLQRFYLATADMNPEQRGKFLEEPPEGMRDIDDVHHAAAEKGQTAAPAIEEDVDLHFVALLQHSNTLYELDGSKSGPIAHGPTTSSSFLKDAAGVVNKYIEGGSSIRFNVIALAARQD